MDDKLIPLAERFNHHISPSTLKAALTHHSFYGNEKQQGNAKYLLAGRYIFKGEVARLLIKYYPAHAEKLEQALGNLFGPKQLDRLWSELNLAPLVRHSEKISQDELRHGYVFALLGCLALHLPYDHLREFIRTSILANIQHLFAPPKQVDYRAQADRLAKERCGKATTDALEQTGEQWRCTVRLGDELLAEAESASRRYAMKKAYKQAVQKLGGQAAEESV